MKLYSYFRSSAAYRTRIALNLKGLTFETVSIHLTRDGGKQHAPSYRAVNPQGRVPALALDDGEVLLQSLAIIEYIDELYPEPPLLPEDPVARARVRAVAQIIACDIHPLNNTGPLNYLRGTLKADDAAVQAWYAHWVTAGFKRSKRCSSRARMLSATPSRLRTSASSRKSPTPAVSRCRSSVSPGSWRSMRPPAGCRLSMPPVRNGSRTRNKVQRLNLTRVVLWMVGALLSFSAMAVSIRALSGKLQIVEILAIRNGGGLALLLALGVARPALMHALATRRLRLHVIRNTIHFGGQYLWAMSLTLLPLATVFALEFTMPAYTALLAVMFLHERMTPSRLGVVIFGFIGVLVILRPGLDTFRPAALLVLVAAFGFAVALTQAKALTATETTFAIVFWMNVIQLPLALLGSHVGAYRALGTPDLLPVAAVALSGLASHFCLAQAFRSGDATLVVPMDFMRIPLIAVVGWWLYGEPLDAYVFAGAGLIVIGVLWNLRAEMAFATAAARQS